MAQLGWVMEAATLSIDLLWGGVVENMAVVAATQLH